MAFSSHPHCLLSLPHLLRVVLTFAQILVSSLLEPFLFLTRVSSITCFFFAFLRTEVRLRTMNSPKETEKPLENSLLHVFASQITVFCGHGTDGQSQASRLPKMIHFYRKGTDKTIQRFGRTKILTCKLK